MGFSHVALSEAYLSAKEGKVGSTALEFSSFPVMGMATTYSASNFITCSSAAGTALSTGTKTNNGMLGVAPDSSELRSIAYDIHDAGYKVGIMTSVTIDHATPGAFYANSLDRNDYYTVAMQLPESGFEFFGGGGFEGLKKMGDRKSPYELAAENGYLVAYGQEDFQAKKDSTEKIIYFQQKGKETEILPYAFERDDNPVRKKPKSPSYVSNNGVINTPKCLSLSLLKPAFRASNAYFHASSPDISRFSKKGRVSENAPIATKRRESPSFAYTPTFSSPGGARKLSEAGSGTHRFFTYLRV